MRGKEGMGKIPWRGGERYKVRDVTLINLSFNSFSFCPLVTHAKTMQHVYLLCHGKPQIIHHDIKMSCSR